MFPKPMQHVKTFNKASGFPLSAGRNNRADSLPGERNPGLWWQRAATFSVSGYVLFTQTLHAFAGWSRLGIGFAALLAIVLAAGRFSGAWDFKRQKWVWLCLPFLIYCLVRGFPEAGNDWPVEQLFPLICAFIGGIGTAFALQVAVPFRAVVYAQVASNLINILAAMAGIGLDEPGANEFRYAGVTGNANEFGLQLALGGCLIWLLPKKAGALPCLFAFVSVAYAVVTSGSRTALLVAPFFLVMVFIQIVASMKLSRRVAFILSTVALILLTGVTLGPLVAEHAREITAVNRLLEHDDSSFNTRLWMIQKGLKLWHQAPLFGNGLDGFERLSGHHGYAHNNFVEILCNTGLMGFLLFYGMHGYVVFKGIWLREPLRLYSWLFILLLVCIDIGSVNYDNKQTIMILLILMSIPVVRQALRVPSAQTRLNRSLDPNGQPIAPGPLRA